MGNRQSRLEQELALKTQIKRLEQSVKKQEAECSRQQESLMLELRRPIRDAYKATTLAENMIYQQNRMKRSRTALMKLVEQQENMLIDPSSTPATPIRSETAEELIDRLSQPTVDQDEIKELLSKLQEEREKL